MKKGRKRVLILLCLLFPGMMGIQGQGVLRESPVEGYDNIMVGSINSVYMSRPLGTQFDYILTVTALRNIRCCSHSVATPSIYDVAPIRSRHRTFLVRCYEWSHLFEVIYRSPLMNMYFRK